MSANELKIEALLREHSPRAPESLRARVLAERRRDARRAIRRRSELVRVRDAHADRRIGVRQAAALWKRDDVLGGSGARR